jgi:hypothetical protein
MPRGQPDYYTQNVPSQPAFGEGQTNWMVAEDGDIAASSYADLAEYTVPDGYELHLMGGAFGSDFPGLTRYSVSLMGVALGIGYMDTFVVLPLHPAAAYVVPALYTMALRVYNDDTIVHNFAALGVGFIVKKGA